MGFGSLVDGDCPDFSECIHLLVSSADRKGMPDAEGDSPFCPLHAYDLAEFDTGKLFGLIPKVDALVIKRGFGPRKEQRMLMGMVARKISGDFLAGGTVDGVDIATAAIMGCQTIRYRFLGFTD